MKREGKSTSVPEGDKQVETDRWQRHGAERGVEMSKDHARFDFLGYRFLRSKQGKLIRRVRPKRKQKRRENLKRPTKRANGKRLEAMIAIINPKLEGWFAYFQQACLREPQELDGWVRMRRRSILRK